MICGRSRCHVLGVKGQIESIRIFKFWFWMQIWTSLRKGMIKCAFFYFLMRAQLNSAFVTSTLKLTVFQSENWYDFALIRKWKKDAHFLIIPFCKESNLQIWEFWSFCNQKLPDKFGWYEFDVLTGRSTIHRFLYAPWVAPSKPKRSNKRSWLRTHRTTWGFVLTIGGMRRKGYSPSETWKYYHFLSGFSNAAAPGRSSYGKFCVLCLCAPRDDALI